MNKFILTIISFFQTITVFAILSTPSLVSPQNAATNQVPDVLLDWSGVTGATGYEYRISKNSDLSNAALFSVSGTSQVNSSNLNFGTVWYWQVRAKKSTAPMDSSIWSAVWNFSTLDQLIPLSPLSGSSGKEPDVLLDWSGITGMTAYDYQWDTSATFNSPISYYSSISSSQVNSFQLRFGTKYYWRVRARHATDTSNWSAVWNFSTLDQLMPLSPLSGSSGKDPEVLLDWSGITGITAYDYQWDTSATFNSPVSYYGSISGSQAYTFQLRFGAKYYWRVRARHATDTTQWSAVWNFSTLDQLMPLSPLSGSSGKEPEVLLDWSGITGISAYDYQWDTSAAFNSPVSYYGSISGSQAYTFQLRFGAKYYWRVRARHATDTTQWSAIWNFSTLDQLVPLSPLSGSSGKEPDVLLDWSGITGMTVYDYQWDTSAAFNSPVSYYGSISGSQAYTFQLRFGAKYYWRVRARHAADTTQWSAIWNFSTLDQLVPLSPLSGSSGKEPDVLLDWSGITGMTAYDYQWDTSATFNSPVLYFGSISGSQAYTFQLRFGTKYYWRVRARHAADTSNWSAVWNFTTIAFPIQLSPINGAINLSLNPTIDWSGFSGITAYQYRFSPNADFANAILATTSTTSQASLVNLLYGTSYFWQVRALHAADTSDWSSSWSFTTLYQISSAPLLLSPANSALNVPFTGTSLQWSSVATATFYEYLLDDDQSFTSPVSGTENLTSASTGDLMPATTYYWKVRAGNGSGFSAWSEVRSFNTGVATKILENESKASLTIVPNPSDGQIQLSMAGKPIQENTPIDIYSLQGKLVQRFEVQNPASSTDLKNLAKGIYRIQIFTEGRFYSEKLIIR